MKLRIKLPLLLLPLTAIALALVGSFCYVKLRKNAEEKTFKQASAIASQISSHVTSSTATALANISLFADYPILRYYLLTEDEAERYDLMQRPLQRKLLSIQKAYPEYYEIRLLLPDGFEDIRLVNRDVDNQTEEEGSTALFQEIQSTSDTFQQFAQNPDNGELAYFLFKKIVLTNDSSDDFSSLPKLRGFLGITMETKVLANMLETNPLGDTGGVLLTDNAGYPLLVPTHLKKFISKEKLLTNLVDYSTHQEFHPIQLASQGYYHASGKIMEGVWLHTLVPEKELVEASRDIGQMVLGITALVLLVSLSIMLYLLKVHVLAPIQVLRKAFLRIGGGEELVQVSLTSQDEFGDLGRELNRMSLELKRSNDKISNMAFCDSLTQLPNRFMFNKNLKRAMMVSLQEGKQLALFFVDLDNFKQINDTLGHQAGDVLLQEVANRLTKNLRCNDCVSRISTEGEMNNLARLGGDEFTFLLPGLDSPMDAKPVAERIIQTISQPISLKGQAHYIGASVGIAIFPGDGDSAEDLIKHADLAMYQAKKQNKGSYHYFSKEASSLVLERTKLEQRLHKALEQEAFELYYQPIIDCQTLEIVSFEALIRWTDEELGAVPPDHFIPVAEDIGLIHEIGDWVIREASCQLKKWQDSGAKNISVAVNVSGRQLERPRFHEQFCSTLRSSGVSPGTFYIELTESAIIQGRQEVLENLHKVRAAGVRVALDDFGTGYSSLSYLRNLPIDILKIDRSFIQELEQHNNSVILSAIIPMAKALNLKVIAEGVEEQGQYAFLKNAGCDLVQGYMFCRPQPVAECTEKLLTEKCSIYEFQLIEP
ncbi:MAG: hypothetical protein BA870_05445 [Desulfuromonadales bacterium C00003094]|jgi:diguanylate cyclase (GGDEF)-like protein|nr:MAG: hypothetical protein BA870_05445 [Desulfuromonadales bacterium C00003094]OEU73771.1 MAG: hypothetical protein BA869_04650 [Desulfuromonadales bacterium C00003107]